MAFLSLIGIGFVGTIFWVVSTEASSVYYATELGWSPIAVGLTAAAGQTLMYGLIYVGGERLIARWAWLHGKVDKVRGRFHHDLRGGYLATSMLAALTGIPPAIGMTALASGFAIRSFEILPVIFAGRAIRFGVLAAVGGSLFG